MYASMDGSILDPNKFLVLENSPKGSIGVSVCGVSARASVEIPNISDQAAKFYKVARSGRSPAIPYRHLGLRITLERCQELPLSPDGLTLDSGIRELVKTFGAVRFVDVTFPTTQRPRQHNIFPDLRFHMDRMPPQEELYSIFMRDPKNPDHKRPRRSSTAIGPNSVMNLQSRHEGQGNTCKPSQTLFERNINKAIGTVLLELRWDAPDGVGEVAIIDNRTVMHASYHRNGRGYPIGVGYLA